MKLLIVLVNLIGINAIVIDDINLEVSQLNVIENEPCNNHYQMCIHKIKPCKYYQYGKAESMDRSPVMWENAYVAGQNFMVYNQTHSHQDYGCGLWAMGVGWIKDEFGPLIDKFPIKRHSAESKFFQP